MKRNKSIQLKAAFLLVVFALNTLVGFACAVGVDMGYNSKGLKTAATHGKEDTLNDHHKEKAVKHVEKNKNDDCCDKEDNCCKNKVLRIFQTDKAVPQVSQLEIPVTFISFIAAYYNIDISFPSQVTPSTKYFVRGHHPPIADIRIAIQSFQI